MNKTKIIAVVILMLACVTLITCGSNSDSDDGSGACEQSNDPYYWCHNFHDITEETGEEICNRVGGDWVNGYDCTDLGYYTECPDGSWIKSSGSCF